MSENICQFLFCVKFCFLKLWINFKNTNPVYVNFTLSYQRKLQNKKPRKGLFVFLFLPELLLDFFENFSSSSLFTEFLKFEFSLYTLLVFCSVNNLSSLFIRKFC
jgi:hypothetical protein